MVSECDNIIRMSIPAVRIAAAKSLNRLGMNQSDIAKNLGVAQAAVSKYLSNRYSKRIAQIEKLIESKGLHKSVVNLVRAKKGTKEILRKIDEIAASNYILERALKLGER